MQKLKPSTIDNSAWSDRAQDRISTKIHVDESIDCRFQRTIDDLYNDLMTVINTAKDLNKQSPLVAQKE